VTYSTVININGERMIWNYPDISFAQIHYLATGKWRQNTPKINVDYRLIRASGAVVEGTVKEGETVSVTLDGELKFNTTTRPGSMIRCNHCTSRSCECV